MPDPTEDPRVDVLDSTWIHARAAVVGAALAEPASWRQWWPGLDLVADELRGPEGVRWTVRSVREAPEARLRGDAEIWLQPADDGVVVHFFLRVDPAPGCEISDREAAAVARSYRTHCKQAFWALADRLDPDRFTRHTSIAHASA